LQNAEKVCWHDFSHLHLVGRKRDFGCVFFALCEPFYKKKDAKRIKENQPLLIEIWHQKLFGNTETVF